MRSTMIHRKLPLFCTSLRPAASSAPRPHPGGWSIPLRLPQRQQRRHDCSKTTNTKPGAASQTTVPSPCSANSPSLVPKMTSVSFWTAQATWRRAAVNTTRCLVGCTTGDFSTMWFLQSQFPELSMGVTMSAAMAAGISTSMILETVLLRMGKDSMPWGVAARTAAGMSLISMLTMELAENATDYCLTGGLVDFNSPMFWTAAAVSMLAGFLAPLPYNYARLRKYGKACH